jgi:aminopeptidase-like protein
MKNEMYELLKRLFPIARSITGKGVRETLGIIQEHIPLTQHEVPSGTKVFDWIVPDEWNIRDAYIMDDDGNRVVDYRQSNLHIVGYSVPFEGTLTLNELKEHLFTLPEQPDLIPYVTSYYEKRWGFCMAHNEMIELKDGNYHVKIDSSLKPGSMTYGEFVVKGNSEKEIMFSTNVCHPSMANNELSGPVLVTYLAKSLMNRAGSTKYSYRFLFLPETIGAITYISKNLNRLKNSVFAGYVITCIGDPGKFSYLKSRVVNTITDRAATHVLKHLTHDYSLYEFLERGSDERQYNAPGVDLPIGSIMRSKHRSYHEYHTSADNLDFVSPKALNESLSMVQRLIDIFEINNTYICSTLCEPQLGKYGLYNNISKKDMIGKNRLIKDVLAYCDGQHDLLAVAEVINRPIWTVKSVIDKLLNHKLIKFVGNSVSK